MICLGDCDIFESEMHLGDGEWRGARWIGFVVDIAMCMSLVTVSIPRTLDGRENSG